MCETKYEDGIWIGRYGNGEGNFGVRFLVKEQSFARRLPDGTYCDVSCTFLPIHRVADLDGRPVVDEGVIEAIADSLQQDLQERPNVSLNRESRISILKQHLSPSREQGEPAERPIVDLRKFGAFPCWEYLNGDEWTCYPSGSGHTRIRHRDGYAIWSAMSLNETLFTRTPPSPTLPPEQERLVGPIAAYFKVDESEARKALATCAGG